MSNPCPSVAPGATSGIFPETPTQKADPIHFSPWANPEKLVDEKGNVKGSTKARLSNSTRRSSQAKGILSKLYPAGFTMSPTMFMTLILLAVSISTFCVLMYLLLFFERGVQTEASVTQQISENSTSSAPALPAVSVTDELGAIVPADIDTPPSDTAIFEMSDREILGLLVSGGVKYDRMLDALKEGERRKIGKLLEASAQVIQSDSYLVRIAAIELMVRSRDRRVVPYLLTSLDDIDALVRLKAAKALGELGDRRALSYLSARLSKESAPNVQVEIKTAVERIKGVR